VNGLERTRAAHTGLAVLVGVSAIALGGCAGNGTLSASARAVAAPLEEVAWTSGTSADVPGLYSSRSIEGPAAAVLAEVHYRFDPDGTFTGAALVTQPSHAYSVLTGTWRVEEGQLYLGADAAPALLEVAGDLLRLSGAEGVVVLERREGV
jgi:hypothetical protein